jgi:hypothetical protein
MLAANEVSVEGKTSRGKQVQIRNAGNGTYTIEFSTGGEVPKILQGEYSFDGAKRQIDKYLKTRSK